jgi:molecular chaperone DnaK
LAEHKDKLEAADVKAIEDAKVALKKAAEGESKDALKSALDEFQSKAQKLGEVIYKQQQAATGATPPPSGSGQAAPGGAQGSNPDEPVDADFEVKA